MATQEKLLKSLEILKNLSDPTQTSDSSKKKDKIQHCHIITEAISNSTIKIAPNFHTYLSITVEVLLQLCDDQESDVRMTAEECLNRIIRASNDGNIGKVQIELHKGIKRNGPARSLRAALWRFSQLAHLIRPHKGKPYVVNLFPTLIKVSERQEEQIHETLANSLLGIMKVLGSFTSDNEIKGLLKAFLKNISNQSAVIRRAASLSIVNICLNCRKPYVFLAYVVHHLLDLLIPVSENHSNYLILGVMLSFRNILPHLKTDQKRESSIFDTHSKSTDLTSLSSDKLLQIYELCLHHLLNKDHNIINSALETLNVLLQNCPSDLKSALINENGLEKSNLQTSSSMSTFRSPSQLSVATSVATEDLLAESELTESTRTDIEKWIDESTLSVMNVACPVEKAPSIDGKRSDHSVHDDSFEFKVEYIPGIKTLSIGDNLERLTLSDDSSEKSFSYIEDDSNVKEIAVGAFSDKDVALIYCARLITKSFLLSGQVGGCISDKTVRVSVKSLALSCISSIVKIYPKIFTLHLDKNWSKSAKNACSQEMADLMLFRNHPDPQLRGVFRILLANFIVAVLDESRGVYDRWIEENCITDKLNLTTLIDILIDGLEDESSHCSRQTILSLNICLEKIIESSSNCYIQPLLDALSLSASNPYWLVKVALCELVAKLPYVTIYSITDRFQNAIVDGVLFELLRHEDVRVRNGAANALVTVIPHLYHEQYHLKQTTIVTKASAYADRYLSNLRVIEDGHDSNTKHLVNNMPFPFSEMLRKSSEKIEFSLSKIVAKLYSRLLTATSKHFIFGCVETLSLLSNTYPTTVYTKAWNCDSDVHSTHDLFNVCVHLLTHSVISYDLNCHSNLLNLTSNLYAGHALCLLKPETDSSTKQPWGMFTTPQFSKLSEHYLSHMVKLLNVFHYVLDEIVPSQLQSKPVLANLSTASPIKRRKSDLDKKVLSPSKSADREEKKDRPNSAAAFVHSPHYMKIYEILRSAYINNYKITLESEACEKFLGLLRQTLHAFSVLMEIGSLVEFQTVAEEILNYFRFTFALEASATVECVQQLLKCLFGNNLTTHIADMKRKRRRDEDKNDSSSFYYKLYQKPYEDLCAGFNSFKRIQRVDCDGDSTIMGYLHRKDVIKTPQRGSDKILANYIRIFEPMVIKSLKHYTITSDVELQCKVLQLLNQLIELRVNYCLLDSEQIFIGFVLKQFEYIEEGQVPLAEELIKKIFQFLVQLSHSKQHSKSIITIPKIIQLCDGLMASGQSPLTHCIPALEPIVENIFLVRNKSSSVDAKELETTREVVLSMLLKLSEYHQVIDLIALILDDSKYCSSNPEKWSRWSRQVVNVILPMLKQNKIRLDNAPAFASLRRLLFVLEPSVFEPIDGAVLALFQETLTYDEWQSDHVRRLGKILILLLILSPLKEDALLVKIKELKEHFVPVNIFEDVVPTRDPLNVLNNVEIFERVASEKIFVKFLFKTLALASKICAEMREDEFLVEELAVLFMYCIHILQSGSRHKISLYAISNVDSIELQEISAAVSKTVDDYPILTFFWCYVLTLLNYNDRRFWSEVTNSELVSPSVNRRIAETGAVILYCDYMSQEVVKSEQLAWFLDGYVIRVVELCNEEPVSEFVSSIHRNPVTSKLFVKALTNCLNKDPVFVLKILKCVENTHPNHTGDLLKLLLPELLTLRELSVSRNVANLARRKIEFLLTMSMEEVNEQLLKEELLEIIRKLVALNLIKKHEALASLLNKLCTQYYEISPLEFDQKRCVNPDHIKKLQIDKNWYLSQIANKHTSKETAQLLTKLSNEELRVFMKSDNFCKSTLKECIRLGLESVKNEKLAEEPALIKASVERLMEEVTRLCARMPESDEVCSTQVRNGLSDKITELLDDESFFNQIYNLIPSLNAYIDSLSSLPNMKLSPEHVEILVKFGLLCLQSVNYVTQTEHRFNVNFITLALNCSKSIFKEQSMCSLLSQDDYISLSSSSVHNLYQITQTLLHDPLPKISKYGLETSENSASVAEACNQLYTLVTWLYKNESSSLSSFIFEPLKKIIVSFARMPVFNSYMLIPTQVWTSGWSPELFGTFRTQVPPLPIEFLQEIDILEEFIFRITLLGWTSRQQFEETWMCLLGVLCNSVEDKEAVEEVVHASSLAVKAITSLLVQTLCLPELGNTNVAGLSHVSRYSPPRAVDLSTEKLKKIHKIMAKRHADGNYLPAIVNVFQHGNFEKRHRRYSYNQMSVKYLLLATKTAEIDDECLTSKMWKQRENLLESSGLDVNSCLQFLVDYYTQLLKQQSTTPLRFLHEIVRSTVIISDLFTDKSQFTWMLEVFFELSKVHTVEDELLHQYLIVGIAKATSVLTPDLETYENVKKILVQYLKSSFLPSRMSCLHGLLYILEGCKLSNICIGGISEEMQIILPCAVEYVQCNLNSNNGILKRSQEHTVLLWTLAFYLLENIDEDHLDPSFVTNTLQVAFTVLLQQKPTVSLHVVLMKAIERLVVFKKTVIKNAQKQILSLALEKIRNENPYISILGMQLLLTYMYTDCAEQLESTDSQTNPDHLVQTIEKVSAIFEHVKKGYFFEVEILCSVLPDILNDFFSPADILTKVIGEFLSPQQPHPKLLSRVVFQIFERAIEEQQLPLLQDWVVFSLSNFTQSLSIGMATWCLTCFFISASSNKWLRLYFPYVQTRVGRYEYEDRRMLCIAGADFYKNLTNEKQKQTFVDNFNKIKEQPDTLFNDLLSSL